MNPDWEAEAGIVNVLFSVGKEQEDNHGGGWMTQYVGVERQAGDGHEWSILEQETPSVSEDARAHVGVFSVEDMTEYSALCT